jgi:hypothetical protein
MTDEPASPSSSAFNFCSGWQLEAPRPVVWQELAHLPNWQQWWPGLEELTPIRAGDSRGIGQKASSCWRGPIGYQFRFSFESTEAVEYELLKGRAEGDLSGKGCWYLGDDDGWTDVRFEWNFDATRNWMEFLAPVARPVVVHGHDYLMKRGANGLAEHLGVQLRGFHSTS